jgi:ribosomal protein S18 acetylase RimI-like enzyme
MNGQKNFRDCDMSSVCPVTIKLQPNRKPLDGDISGHTLRRLHPYSARDIIALNKLLHSSLQYYLLHTNAPPLPDAAQKLLLSIPNGKTENNKFVMALFDEEEMIACVDILREYPRKEIAIIKLLLVAEPFQDQGLGSDLLAQITKLIRSWGCSEIQLGVCTSNPRGFKFWRRHGFRELRREPLPGYTGDAIVMRRTF